MRKIPFRSFRTRLLAAFLAVSLIPILICSTLLLQIFRLRMTDNTAKQAQEQLHGATQSLDDLYDGLLRAADMLCGNALLASALTGAEAEDTQVYHALFNAVEEMRPYARFDLYDMQGRWRYSTHQAPLQEELPVNWGILYAASSDGLTFAAAESTNEAQSPLLQAAVVLTTQGGQNAGYLLISMSQTHLRQLLEGTYNAQDNLMLLSAYWHPIYCASPSLAATLAPVLRRQLLTGEPLDAVSDDFLYNVAHHPSTGLYVVLQSPWMFTRETMRVLFTVTLTSILICVAVSLFVSIQFSRKMFAPIGMLHRAIGEVEQDNLDARVPPHQEDELGQLTERFNEMLTALKRNREQLVENQRELNQAQIRMLQAQLNPHFLGNTLDTMKWISKINKVPQVALMATNLADILRFCISSEEFVPLRREAELVDRYMEIQNIRLSGAFVLELSLPEDLENCMVPKMILQPLVENAILHGLDGMTHGIVRVEADVGDRDLLTLRVSDNGRGFPSELVGPYACRAPELAEGHLGLYNVDAILTKYYGAGCGLYLENKADGGGAVVTAVLPVRKGIEKEVFPC